MRSPDESELLGRAKGGNRQAFEALLAPHLPGLLAYIRVICGDHHAAHDALQQTLLIAYRKLGLFFAEADFATWLRAIARREALDMRKKLARAPSAVLDLIEACYEDPVPHEPSPRARALDECLKRLDGRAGDVVRGHYFDGTNLEAMARGMGTSVSSVKQLLYRVRLSLRECIRKRLGTETA